MRLNLLAVIVMSSLLGACATTDKAEFPEFPEVTSSPEEISGKTTPRPIRQPVEMVPYVPPTPTNTWSNVTNLRAVSSSEQPRLVVECSGDKMYIRHDDQNQDYRQTSRTVFNFNDKNIVLIGDQYNNVLLDQYNLTGNMAERLYQVLPTTTVTVVTDGEVSTSFTLNGYREAVDKVFAACNV